ncbi:MAG: winged helix-turn-helix domain-containing protein [Dehalobacterium sp.]
MESWILKVGNSFNGFEAAQKEWLKYHVFMKTAQSMPEALIRRYTVLNHKTEKPLTILTYLEIFICVEYRKVFLKSQEIKLTRREFDLLYLLLSSAGRVYTHENIYRYVWADEMDEASENYAVWCLVARVRKKLRSVPDTLNYIKTVRDVGYCIDTVLK